MDTLTEELPESRLQALLADEPLEVPVLATDGVQQVAVDTGGAGVDRAADQREELLLAPGQAARELRATPPDRSRP
jgi:hypothetical protein